MSEQFSVGEVAIGQNCDGPGRNGVECTVVDGLAMRTVCHTINRSVIYTIAAYLVTWPNGEVTASTPDQLRKKRPPTTGEQAIRDLFLVAPADRRATVESRAEYWAAYEYTHLMIACDVRGLPGAQP
jgi:hypothetical protein